MLNQTELLKTGTSPKTSCKLPVPITVCTGCFCAIKSREKHLDILNELKLAAELENIEILISKTDCLGLCSKSPAIKVGDTIFSNLTVSEIIKIIRQNKKEYNSTLVNE